MTSKSIALVAAFCLLLAAGLYVMFAGSGNVSSGLASNAPLTREASCSLAAERGKAVAEAASGDVAAFRALDAGLDLQTISFKDANGEAKTLADWQGKVVLFNLWATWCPPCREEMPYLEELQVKKGGEGFQVVPVSIDLGDMSKPAAFYEETGLKQLPFFHDNSMQSFQTLRKKAVALGMPTTLLMDANGCGLGVLNGPAHWASPDAIKLVEAAIQLPES